MNTNRSRHPLICRAAALAAAFLVLTGAAHNAAAQYSSDYGYPYNYYQNPYGGYSYRSYPLTDYAHLQEQRRRESDSRLKARQQQQQARQQQEAHNGRTYRPAANYSGSTPIAPRSSAPSTNIVIEEAQQPSSRSGEEIRQLQERLTALGFDPGPADGVLGPQTEAALENFRREKGITDSDPLGEATLNALAKAHTERVSESVDKSVVAKLMNYGGPATESGSSASAADSVKAQVTAAASSGEADELISANPFPRTP